MINFEAAKDVLEFFKEKGVRETGGSLLHEVIATDMVRDHGVTLPWVADGLIALTDMCFILPTRGDANEAHEWQLTSAGAFVMRKPKICSTRN